MHIGGIMSSPNLLIFGGPNSGKTHYAAQLVGRLKRNPGKLSIRVGDGSTDLSALEEVLSKLEDGNSADHTPTQQYSEINLPLQNENKQNFDLFWPDYGGEQISNLFKERAIDPQWRERLKESNGWLLFIRLSSETTYPDALSDLTAISANKSEEFKRPDIWDANAYYIELLQMLCHVAEINLTSPQNKPPIGIILSCYDEVHESEKTPADLMKSRLPLLNAFIKNTWLEEKVSIWGGSALGKKLKSNSQDDDFIDDGPENQGWVISPTDNNQNKDLSAPLAWMLDSL